MWIFQQINARLATCTDWKTPFTPENARPTIYAFDGMFIQAWMPIQFYRKVRKVTRWFTHTFRAYMGC
jgi:hypothetical protein